MNNYKHDKITPTADLISYFRIFSDTPYTQEIAEITNAEQAAKDMLGEHLKDSSYLAAMSEARYKRIDIHARHYKNILEVAIGRSPRGLIFTEDPNINYVATDLPDSLELHKAIIQELINRHNLKRPNLHFAPANALDFDALKSALDLLPAGPVAIISEGFMIYLTMEEKTIFLSNIRRILLDRGGSLITPDVVYFPKIKTMQPGLLEVVARRTGRDMRDLGWEGEEQAKEFFSNAGFEAKTFLDDVELVSVNKLHLENDSQTQNIIKYPVWILSPKKE